MPFIEWDTTLDVSVDAMNSEHKVLIGLMNKLFDENEAGAEHSTLLATLNELAKYTVKHFGDEEEYMESIQYPDLAKHKLIHKDLLAKFGEHKENFEKSSEKLPDAFFDFLRLWLSAHIKGLDVKYGAHAKDAKAS